MANSGAYYFIDVIWCVCAIVTADVSRTIAIWFNSNLFPKNEQSESELHANLGNPNDFLCVLFCVSIAYAQNECKFFIGILWKRRNRSQLKLNTIISAVEIETSHIDGSSSGIRRGVAAGGSYMFPIGWKSFAVSTSTVFGCKSKFTNSETKLSKMEIKYWLWIDSFSLLTCSHADAARHSTRIYGGHTLSQLQRTHFVILVIESRHEQFEMQNFVYIFNVLFQLINSRIKCLTPSFVPFHSLCIYSALHQLPLQRQLNTLSLTLFSPFARTRSVPRSTPTPRHPVRLPFCRWFLACVRIRCNGHINYLGKRHRKLFSVNEWTPASERVSEWIKVLPFSNNWKFFNLMTRRAHTHRNTYFAQQ